jgi:hypothetical protein
VPADAFMSVLGNIVDWIAFHWTTIWQLALLWVFMGVSSELSKMVKLLKSRDADDRAIARQDDLDLA